MMPAKFHVQQKTKSDSRNNRQYPVTDKSVEAALIVISFSRIQVYFKVQNNV